MLKTQKLFKELGYEKAIAYLTAEPINMKVKEYDNFAVLNYCQIFSPETDEYVMECRSLQLDKQGEVVSRAYPRFFNYGQHPDITGNFVFEGSTILEKADGSLIRIYWNPYDNRWEIGTRGTAFAEAPQDFYETFREAVIEDGFGLKDEEAFQEFCNQNLNEEFTFVFEYCSIRNRIVTLYKEPIMFLIAVINNSTGVEFGAEHIKLLANYFKLPEHIKPIGAHEFDTIEDMIKGVEELTDLKEGFVAQDKNGLRIKMKNALYLKLHRMKGNDGFTPKKITAVVAENEQDEVFVYFPEYKDMFKPYIIARNVIHSIVKLVWNNHVDKESQKDFALAVKDYKFSALLFNMRKTGKSFQEVWNETRLDFKIELILDYIN